jgi:hypothetical protein
MQNICQDNLKNIISILLKDNDLKTDLIMDLWPGFKIGKLIFTYIDIRNFNIPKSTFLSLVNRVVYN